MTPNRTLSDFYTYPDLTGQPGLPPPNASLPKKLWADPQAPATDPMTYQVWNGSDTQPALVPLIVPAAQRFANIPGDPPVFPSYAPAPTAAVGNVAHGLTSAMIGPLLSMRSDADALAALIPGTQVKDPYDPAFNAYQHILYPGAEARRTWLLVYPNGGTAFVGSLLFALNAKGVGFPGSWDASNGTLVWVPGVAPTGAVAAGPAVPFPLSLPAGAKLVSIVVGAGLSVVQVQLEDSSSPASTGSGDGSFTAADRARAIHIEKMLVALLNADRVEIPAA